MTKLQAIRGMHDILMHEIPPRFNLPFPSFRLLKSLKLVDSKYKTKTVETLTKLYSFKNENRREIIEDYSKAYKLMNKIKKSKNPDSENLGFFDMEKIKYNVEGLRMTFEDYPFVFAYRFIVGCLVDWSFDKNLPSKERNQLFDILLRILGIKELDMDLVKEKLMISENLIHESEKL